ncbi:MAG: hypothetical protein ACK5HY_15385 [Parahaliea sp.]
MVPICAALGNAVTVSPLIKMTGETGFNAVIFDALEVDDGFRLDELGWELSTTPLEVRDRLLCPGCCWTWTAPPEAMAAVDITRGQA